MEGAILSKTYLENERLNRGWSRSELARRAAMQPGVITWIEEGRFKPYASQLKKLALALDIDDPESLLEHV